VPDDLFRRRSWWRALKAGARGYLLKYLHKELLETIRACNAGQKGAFPLSFQQLPSMPPLTPLDPGERVLLRLIAGRECQQKIAAQLSISERT